MTLYYRQGIHIRAETGHGRDFQWPIYDPRRQASGAFSDWLNKLWAVHKWLPVFIAMPRMLAELDRKPEAGLISNRTYFSGRVFLVQQYWESFDKLIAYAHDVSAQHFPAWAAFNRAVGKDGTVGVWHETYLMEPGKFETIYGNMPLFGLAAATSHVPAEGGLAAAKDRMRGG